jgi:hypothetical protein
MAAKFCPSVLSASRLNTVLTILLHPAVKRDMLFPVVLAAAQCLQSLPAESSPTSSNITTTASSRSEGNNDGSVSAIRALLLDATEGICTVLVGDFVREDSEYSKYVIYFNEYIFISTYQFAFYILMRILSISYLYILGSGSARQRSCCTPSSIHTLAPMRS